MPAQQPSKRKAMPKHERKNTLNDVESLYAKAGSRRYQLFFVHEIRRMFGIDDAAMRRFRKLSSRDPETDPWINDKTRPEKFHEWLWGKRIELEKKHRDI
jgi:hypothetical protein